MARRSAFVEVDRDNESAKRLADKVTQYYAYRADSGDNEFTVHLVTIGSGRGDGPLEAAGTIAQKRHMPRLDLRVTMAAELAICGP